jgi:hypothetical protein
MAKATDSKSIVKNTLRLSPRGLTMDDLITQTGLGKRNIRRILLMIDGEGELVKGLAGWQDMRKMRYGLRG